MQSFAGTNLLCWFNRLNLVNSSVEMKSAYIAQVGFDNTNVLTCKADVNLSGTPGCCPAHHC